MLLNDWLPLEGEQVIQLRSRALAQPALVAGIAGEVSQQLSGSLQGLQARPSRSSGSTRCETGLRAPDARDNTPPNFASGCGAWRSCAAHTPAGNAQSWIYSLGPPACRMPTSATFVSSAGVRVRVRVRVMVRVVRAPRRLRIAFNSQHGTEHQRQHCQHPPTSATPSVSGSGDGRPAGCNLTSTIERAQDMVDNTPAAAAHCLPDHTTTGAAYFPL